MAVRLLHGSLAIPAMLDGAESLERTVRTWADVAPDLLPDRADRTEPVRRSFDPNRLSDALSDWNSRLWIARRSKPSVQINVLGSFGHTNSTMHISLPTSDDGQRYLQSLVQLIRGLSGIWRPDLAVVHSLCDSEIVEARAARRPDIMITNRRTGSVAMSVGFSRELEHGLTSLYWLNIFGARYEGLFGPALFAAPWASVERHPFGIICKVSELAPTDATWPEFRTAREEIVRALGTDAFWPNGERVPDLSLQA